MKLQPAKQAKACSLGWSVAEPQEREFEKTEPMKWATAWLLGKFCRPLRGLKLILEFDLGFR